MTVRILCVDIKTEQSYEQVHCNELTVEQTEYAWNAVMFTQCRDYQMGVLP